MWFDPQHLYCCNYFLVLFIWDFSHIFPFFFLFFSCSSSSFCFVCFLFFATSSSLLYLFCICCFNMCNAETHIDEGRPKRIHQPLVCKKDYEASFAYITKKKEPSSYEELLSPRCHCLVSHYGKRRWKLYKKKKKKNWKLVELLKGIKVIGCR